MSDLLGFNVSKVNKILSRLRLSSRSQTTFFFCVGVGKRVWYNDNRNPVQTFPSSQRGVLHSRNVVDDFRNLFGNVQKFGNNIEIWKLEAKFDWFFGARNPLCDRDLQELVIL